jgi:hypothetical protein
MSEHRVLFLRNGLVAGCAFAALVLLASFYSIVSGAVDRASRHRLAVADGSAVAATPAPALGTPPSHHVTLVSRVDN